MADTIVTVGLLLRLEAAPGRENNIPSLPEGAISMVNEEPKAMAWFGPSTFGIFDVFPDEEGREAHPSGRVAAALIDNVGEHLQEPTIERIDVIASKLPG